LKYIHYPGSGGKEKYKEVYQLVREVIDENGGECNCK